MQVISTATNLRIHADVDDGVEADGAFAKENGKSTAQGSHSSAKNLKKT